MISIVIPVYNQAEHLANLLNSIKQQTYDNYEIIIVNDGSTDNSAEVAKQYQYKFKTFSYHQQENRGANAARNRGAKEAIGSYIIFCDADVVMESDMLETMSKTLDNNPSASYCYSSFILGHKLFKLWAFDAEKLKKMPYITTTSLIRREHFPGFDENLRKFQDWDLWLTMLEKERQGLWINRVLFKIQTSGTQTMSRWLPSFAYKWLPFLPWVKKYNQAKEIIRKKHKLG